MSSKKNTLDSLNGLFEVVALCKGLIINNS